MKNTQSSSLIELNQFLYIVIDTFGIIPASICSQFIFLSSSSLSWIFLNWSCVCFGFFPLLFWKALYFISIELTASEKFPKPVSQHFYSIFIHPFKLWKQRVLGEKQTIFWKWETSVLWCIFPDIFLPIYNLSCNERGMPHTLEKHFTLMYHVGFCQYIFRTMSFSITGQCFIVCCAVN